MQSDIIARKIFILCAFALIFAGALFWRAALPVYAAPTSATYTVSGSADGVGNCNGAFVCTTLRAGVIAANANPGSTIVLGNGTTYTLTLAPVFPDDATTGDLNITANTTILRATGCIFCFDAVITGGAGWSDDIFNVHSGTTVTLSNLTIKNGNSVNSAGGVYNAGNLTLNYVTVISNSADAGGGIYNYSSGVITMTGGNVLSNTATSLTLGGGGIFNAGGIVSATNATIAYNKSFHDGGGLYAGGIVSLTNTSVTTNTASNGGGGMIAYGALNVTGGSVSGNTGSNSYGGGIYYSGAGPVGISGTLISGNSSFQDGGGMYGSGTGLNVTLTNTTVSNNKTITSYGGGVSYSSDGILMINGSTINNNTSGWGWGGGVIAVVGAMTMTNSTVSGNNAYQVGGGLALQTRSASIASSLIANNVMTGTSGMGGGIYAYTGTLNILNTTISGNNLTGSSSFGGALFNGTGNTLIDSSLIYSNTANAGGGIAAGGTITVVNSTLSGNTATNSGGAISIQTPTNFLLSNVTIANNQAASVGGGILGAYYPTTQNSLIANNVSPTGTDCFGGMVSQGYNLLGTSSGCVGLTNGVNGDQVGSFGSPINPLIAALGNYGGSTFTHALLKNSPAINLGNPGANDGTGTHCMSKDQRGYARAGSRCDIGAFEFPNQVFLPFIVR